MRQLQPLAPAAERRPDARGAAAGGGGGGAAGGDGCGLGSGRAGDGARSGAVASARRRATGLPPPLRRDPPPERRAAAGRVRCSRDRRCGGALAGGASAPSEPHAGVPPAPPGVGDTSSPAGVPPADGVGRSAAAAAAREGRGGDASTASHPHTPSCHRPLERRRPGLPTPALRGPVDGGASGSGCIAGEQSKNREKLRETRLRR